MDNDSVIEELIGRMEDLLESLRAAADQRQHFHATYLRTTIAVAEKLRGGGFNDARWVERWDVAFAGLYLDALQTALAGRRPTRPWDVAFNAPAGLPPLRYVLLGMNAHVNYDLPQALLAVITDEEFADLTLLARRESDHRVIDEVLASRVGAEDDELAAISGPGSPLDRLLRPLSRLGTRRFLREAREKVWANAVVLSEARMGGPETYASALKQLEELSAAKVAALQAPGQVLLKLAATGFGVRLTGVKLPALGRIADGDHHADVAVRELSLAKMAQGVEEPGNRHHHTVLRADPALNRIEVSAGEYQFRCPLR
jgi:Family of unknown function (DUF5995)